MDWSNYLRRIPKIGFLDFISSVFFSIASLAAAKKSAVQQPVLPLKSEQNSRFD